NPMWEPEANGPSRGHFLCVDGFGPVTAAERDAGFPEHGEANKLPWEVLRSTESSATFRVRLPLAQETLTRTVTMAPNEQVVLVETSIESALAFDRVILWAEHATIGAPFLTLGKTVVDQSARRCRTKSYSDKGQSRFPEGAGFEWPNLPGHGDMRRSPARSGVYEHIGCLMDEGREDAFVTAIATDQNLLLGYLFPRRDFPWVQHWMHYPDDGAYAWGLEFGMQPYDMTRADVVALSPMFGTPTYRWLPAKSTLSTRFLMFAAKVPGGFDHVDDVRLEKGTLVIEGTASQIVLDYSGKW
ncbi:MAG TPA: hypothetical protein VJ921_12110, partial [Vicinamibacteria bacterium]|nr:hypothetical protein [Vicinamibacteria bacterium]